MNKPHIPSLTLEEIVTGERERSDEAVGAHLSQCGFCRQRLTDMEVEDRAYLIQRPPAPFVTEVLKRHGGHRQRQRGWLLAIVAAASATAVLVLLPLNPSDQLTARGPTSVKIFQVDGDGLRPVTNESLAAGTHLRFRVHLVADGFLCVFHSESGEKLLQLPQRQTATTVNEGDWFVPGTYALTGDGGDAIVVAFSQTGLDCNAVREGLNRPLVHDELNEGPWDQLLIKRLPAVTR